MDYAVARIDLHLTVTGWFSLFSNGKNTDDEMEYNSLGVPQAIVFALLFTINK